jgi:hypothetical protein
MRKLVPIRHTRGQFESVLLYNVCWVSRCTEVRHQDAANSSHRTNEQCRGDNPRVSLGQTCVHRCTDRREYERRGDQSIDRLFETLYVLGELIEFGRRLNCTAPSCSRLRSHGLDDRVLGHRDNAFAGQ